MIVRPMGMLTHHFRRSGDQSGALGSIMWCCGLPAPAFGLTEGAGTRGLLDRFPRPDPRHRFAHPLPSCPRTSI